MSAIEPSFTPNWYPDPLTPGTSRYFDGSSWTDHRRPTRSLPSSRTAAGAALPWAIPSMLAGLAMVLLGIWWHSYAGDLQGAFFAGRGINEFHVLAYGLVAGGAGISLLGIGLYQLARAADSRFAVASTSP